ncbi:YopX family protein [Millionella massiliensis]|uniref:YopX family protein n=1 Tax=Millionella massiliensis TaxID=1871023 RepID=UPI0008DAC47C|nr:YopX family protein [Millionella massiliensis]
MREIKFRGKSLETGEWIFGDLIENQGRFFIYKASSETTFKDDDDGQIVLVAKEVDQKTVGQYTGLKDKNGKDVWEGDIVMLEYNDEDYPSPTYPFVIVFSYGAFCIAEDKETPWAPIYDHGIMELIGNLWDNPELLKGGEE